jgi:hypothetical protein
VEAAGGNYTTLSISGAVVAVHIKWTCNLDFDFENNCLPEYVKGSPNTLTWLMPVGNWPRYHFRLLDSVGWNFRHAHFHEEGRRTLYKAYGIKFVIIVQGRAGGERKGLNKVSIILSGKFDLKNSVINIVAGLGLLSFITMFCDFILLNYVSERTIVSCKTVPCSSKLPVLQVKERKFEVLDKTDIMAGLLTVLASRNTTDESRGFISDWKVILDRFKKNN